jgi:hypothetical protein
LAASCCAGAGTGIGKSSCCSIPKRSLIFCSYVALSVDDSAIRARGPNAFSERGRRSRSETERYWSLPERSGTLRFFTMVVFSIYNLERRAHARHVLSFVVCLATSFDFDDPIERIAMDAMEERFANRQGTRSTSGLFSLNAIAAVADSPCHSIVTSQDHSDRTIKNVPRLGLLGP